MVMGIQLVQIERGRAEKSVVRDVPKIHAHARVALLQIIHREQHEGMLSPVKPSQ